MDRNATMKGALLILIVTAGLICSGCSSGKYVGVWDISTSRSSKPGHSSLTFNKDGTFKSSFETRTNIIHTRAEGSGTYTSDRDTLTLDYRDVKLYYLHPDGSTKGVVPMHSSKSVEKVKVVADGRIELNSDTHPDTWRLVRR